jgi:hypothetical protein
MSKPRFVYRVDEQQRTLRVALARLARAANADTEPLGRYLLAGGRITDWDALGRALIPTKPRRGRKSTEAAEVADNIRHTENRWRKANPGKRLPYGYRPKLVERHVFAAWLQDGQWQSTYKKVKDPNERLLVEEAYKNAVKGQILNALETKRKNKSKRPRIKTG